jgi:ubiquinone/menaquinone biosynthesis C-methylase UbiE
MGGLQDQNYLLSSQYKDATNFSVRVDLHRRFSVNTYGFHCWVFDHFPSGEKCKILELGCGPGFLWLSNQRRIPANWQIVLSDFSPGMLQEARQRLGEEHFAYQVVDAQAIPFADESFDVVIANHMLYHVPNLPQALNEIRRVLKPGGHLYATTFGREYMRELDELIVKRWPASSWQGMGARVSFLLENGQKILAPFFAQITTYLYENALEVTEAEPLVAYVLSGSRGSLLTSEQRESLTSLVRQELTTHGTLHITTASGMFEARKAENNTSA